MSPRDPSSNGRATPRRPSGVDPDTDPVRRRSPMVRWVALLLVVALGAGVLASLAPAFLR